MIWKSVFKNFEKVSLNYKEYIQNFTNLYRVTNVSKCRDFQYRLLNNSILTNNCLFYWNIVDSKNCEFCQDAIQIPLHLFVTCQRTTRIWEKVQQFIKECTFIHSGELTFSPKNIMCNSMHNNPGHIANFFALFVKQFIFSCKCHRQKILFHDIIVKFELIYQHERYNARINSTTNKHKMKWAPYTGKEILQSKQVNNSLDPNSYVIEHLSTL